MNYNHLFLWILFLPVSILGYFSVWIEIAWSVGRGWHLSKEQKSILRSARKLPE